MKKLMMAAVALICMTMMSVSLTACGGDDDSPSKQKQQIEYLVTGNLIYSVPDKSKADPIPASWNGVFAGPMQDYSNIVQEIAPSPNYENRDVAIKNACEEVYNKHKALKGIEYTGTIKVQRTDSEEPVWEKKY
jgi:hypothetical protein